MTRRTAALDAQIDPQIDPLLDLALEIVPDLRPDPVSLDGALETSMTERLRARLEDEIIPGRRLALDLSGVTHLSAAALAVLVGLHRRLRDCGGSLVICTPSEVVIREMRVSGLYRVIEVDGLSLR